MEGLMLKWNGTLFLMQVWVFCCFFCTDVIANHMLCKGFWMIDQNPLLFTFYVVLGFVGWANLAAVGVILFHLADVGTKTFRQGIIGDTRQLDVVDVAVAIVTNVSRCLMVAKRQKKNPNETFVTERILEVRFLLADWNWNLDEVECNEWMTQVNSVTWSRALPDWSWLQF